MSHQSPARAARWTAALVVIAVLTSCANMLTGNDVTQSISTEVTAANAKTSEITVRIDPAMNGGTISAPGFKSVQKLGIPFGLSVDVGTNFAFKGWTILGDGSLKIVDAAQPATSATIYKTAWKEPTVIQANFFRRPTLTINPINGGEVVNRNRKILLRFDHAMNPSTLLFPDSVMISENAMTNGAGWADVTKTYFSEILPNDKAGMEYYLAFASSGTLLKPYTYYKITVLKQAADTNGVAMVDDVVSQFSTGASADNSPPSITTYVGASALTPDSNRATTLFTNTATVYLSVTAIDDSGAVPTLTIQELLGPDPASPLKSRSTTMTTTAGYFEYPLNAVWGEGPRTIAVQGTDSIGNISAATEKNAQVVVFFDMTKPVISSFPLKGLSNTVSQTLNLSASDSQGSGLASYTLSGDVTAGPVRQTTEASSTQLAFTLPPGDGQKKITLTVIDKAGNTTEETKALVLDTLAPQAPSKPEKIQGRTDAFNAGEASTQFRVSIPADAQIGDTLSVTLNGKPLSVTTLGPTAISERSQVLTVTAESLGNDGTLTLLARVTDQAGNLGADSPSLNLLKDVALPSLVLGNLSTNNTADGSFARTGNQVSLTFTPADVNLTGSASVVLAGVAQTVPVVSGSTVTVRQVLGAQTDGLLDYSVALTDAAGNTSSSSVGAQGTVTIDNTAPSFTMGTFGSSNGSNALFAKDGDTITLNFRLTETNLDPTKLTGTFVGKPVTVTPLGGGSYKASLKVLPDWNDGTSYPVAYSLTAMDRAGNTTTIDSGALGSVTIDFSQPDFDFKSLVSDNHGSPSSYAKTGDTITMRFTAVAQGSALNDVRGIIAGHDVAAMPLGGGLFEATYVMTATDTEGPVTYQIRASNQTGRTFTTNYPDPSTVVFDRTAPQVTLESFLSNNASSATYTRLLPQADKLTLKFKAADLHLTTVAEVTIAGVTQSVWGLTTGGSNEVTITPSVLAEGMVPFTVTVTDLAGNTTQVTQTSPGVPLVTADSVAPVIKQMTLSSSNSKDTTWAKKDDVISLTFTVVEVNGVAPTVTLAGKPATVTSTGPGTYSAVWTVKDNDTQDTVAFEIRAGDRAGNLTIASSGATGTVAIDTIAPVITLGTLVSNNAHAEYARKDNTASLTFKGTDAHMEPQAMITIGAEEQTVSGLVTNVFKTAAQVLTTAPEGVLAYKVVLTDKAGNTATATSGASSSVMVDNLKPVLTFNTFASNNATNTAFARNGNTLTLSFQAEDLHLTDATNLFTKVEGFVTGNVVSVLASAVSTVITASVSTTLAGMTSAQDGPAAYTLTVQDLAGNTTTVSTGATGTVTIDNTPPEITMGTQTSDNLKNFPNSTWAKAGNTVTQKFLVKEKNTLSVTGTLAASGPLTPLDLGSAGTDQRNYSVSRVVDSGDAQGAIAYGVTVTDQAGNTPPVANTGAMGTIKIDTIVPKVTVGVPSLTQASSTGTVNFGISTEEDNPDNGNDHLSTSKVTLNISLASGALTTPSATKAVTNATTVTLTGCNGDGTLGITIEAGAKEDLAGNLSVASAPSATLLVDNTAPTLSGFTALNPTPVYLKGNTEVKVQFSVTDPYGGSGVGAAPKVTFASGSASTTVDATYNAGHYEAVYTPSTAETANGDIVCSVLLKDVLLNAQTVSSLGTSKKLDNTKPSVSNVAVSTSGNTGYAKDDNTVTMTFKVTEDSWSSAPGVLSVKFKDSINDKEATATVSGTFPNLTASYTMKGTDSLGQGNLNYHIDVTDAAGNTMDHLTADTLICYDNRPPTVDTLTLASDNTPTTWAKAGSKITLGFHASDTNWTTTGATATIAGKPATLDLSVAIKTAKVTVAASGDPQVTVGYTLVLYDLAGNKTEVAVVGSGAPGSAGTVTIDTVAPELTLKTLASENTTNTSFAKNNDKITLGFRAKDDYLSRIDGTLAGNLVTKTTLTSDSDDSLSTTITGLTIDKDGPVTYSLTVKDLAGNETPLSIGATGTVTIDNTPPEITMGTQTSDNLKNFPNSTWAKAGNTVTQKFLVKEKNTLSVTGTLAASGPLTPLDLGSAGTDQRNYSVSRVVDSGDAQGAIAYGVTVTDQAGNTLPVANTGAMGTIKIDTKVPKVTVGSPSLTQASKDTVGNLTFGISTEEDNPDSGNDHLSTSKVTLNASLASGALTTPSATKAVTNATTVTLTSCNGDGTLGITIEAGAKEDLAGNLSLASAPSATLLVDNTAPSLSDFTALSPSPVYLKGNTEVKVKFSVTDPYGGSGVGVAPKVTFVSGSASTTVDATYNAGHYEAVYTPSTAENANGDIVCSVILKDVLLNDQTVVSLDTLKKLDNTKPTVTNIAVSTSGNSGYAKDNDTVTVTFKVTEASWPLAPGNLSVKFKDSINSKEVTATVSGPFPNYTASYKMSLADSFGQGNLNYHIDVTDAAGNAMDHLTADTSICYDNVPPTVDTLTLASDNTPTTWAKAGSKITLGFHASDTNWTTTGATATIAGKPATLDLSVANKTAKVTVAASGDPQVTVGYTLVLYDLAGNKTEVAVVGSGTPGDPGTVTIDTVAPELTLKTLASENTTNTSFAKNNDKITLGFRAKDDYLSRIDGTLAGNLVTKTTLTSDSDDSLSTTITGLTIDKDGPVTYSLTVKDLAGNETPLSIGATGSVTIDNTPPEITMGTQTSDNLKDSTHWAKAGNTVTQLFMVKEKNTRSVTGSLAASGPLTPTFLGSPGTDERNYSVSRVVDSNDAQGAIAYSAAVTDQAGNTLPVANTGAVGTIKIDTKVPKVTVSAPSLTQASSTGTVNFVISTEEDNPDSLNDHLSTSKVTLNASLASGASITPSATKSVTNATTVTLTSCNGDGTLGITIEAGAKEDLAGNLSDASAPSATLLVDNTAPSLSDFTALSPSPVYLKGNTEVKVKFSVTDGGSGVGEAPKVTFVSGSASTTVDATYNAGHYEAVYTPSTAETANGDIVCSVLLKDVLLNAQTVSSLGTSKKLDNTKPSVSNVAVSTSGNTGYAKDGDTVTVTFKMNDNSGFLAGNPSVAIEDGEATPHTVTATISGSSTYPDFTATYTMKSEDKFKIGNLKYRIDASDLAGNPMDAVAAVTTIFYDNVPPTVAFSSPSRPWANKTAAVTYTLTYSDNKTTAFTSGGASLVTAHHPDTATGGTVTKISNTEFQILGSTGEGTLGIEVAAGLITDEAGNPNSVTTTTALESFGVDNTPPTVTISGRSRAWTNVLNEVTYNLTYHDTGNHPLGSTSTNAGLITVTQSSKVTGVTPSLPSAGVVSLVGANTNLGDEGSVYFSVQEGYFTDAAGNLSVASADSEAFQVDNTPPELAFNTLASSGNGGVWAKANDTLTITFTSSDAHWKKVTSTVAGHGVTVTNLTAGAGTTTVTVSAGDNSVGVPYTLVAEDEAGNMKTISGTESGITIDTKAPTVTFNGPSRAWTNKDTAVTYDLVYHDDYAVGTTSTNTGLITVTMNGGVTGATATLPTANQVSLNGALNNGTVAISVKAGFYTDQAGNLSEASAPSTSYGVDNAKPIVSISGPTYTSATKVDYVVTTSEIPLGYELKTENLTFTAPSAPTIVNGTTASATVTFTVASDDGTVSFLVKAGTVTDAAGNSNDATSASSGAPYAGGVFPAYHAFLAGERTLPETKLRSTGPATGASPAPSLWAMVTEAFFAPPALETPAAPVLTAPMTPPAHQAAWVAASVTPVTTLPVKTPSAEPTPAPTASPSQAPPVALPQVLTPATTVAPTAPTPAPSSAPAPASAVSTAPAAPTAPPVPTVPPATPSPAPVPERTPSGYPPLWNQTVEEPRKRRPGLV